MQVRCSSSRIELHALHRPFNKRETDLKSELIVSMSEGCQVEARPPSNYAGSIMSDPFVLKCAGRLRPSHRAFVYDHAFWSHDESSAHFATQKHVYDSVGVELLQNALDGFGGGVCAKHSFHPGSIRHSLRTDRQALGSRSV